MKAIHYLTYFLVLLLIISCNKEDDVPFAPDEGSGSAADPYEISTLDQLCWISIHSEEWDKHFVQMNDIDMSGDSDCITENGFTPIGSDQAPHFTGSYDGQNFAISNLTISGNHDLGLFGRVVGAELKNIVMENTSIYGDGSYLGSLVGFAGSGATIQNCHAEGNVKGTANDVGGLIGLSEGSQVDHCSFGGAVEGAYRVGGLIGTNGDLSDVSRSFALATVYASGKTAGGLIASNKKSNITDCYASGSVISTTEVGGLVGANAIPSENVINKCYASCLVTATDNFFGEGGLIGFGTGEGEVLNSFWDEEYSQKTDSDGGTAKTTSEMKNVNTFTLLSTNGLDQAWDFLNNPNNDNGLSDTWDISPLMNNGYPLIR